MTCYRVSRGHALWLFGLSGAGKTTVSSAFKEYLEARDVPVVLFDGDITREIVGEGVGRSEEDRVLLTKRYVRLTSYLTESRIIVLLAAINHTEAQRRYARANHPEGQFGLVWINTPLGICMERDPKGLYRHAKEIVDAGGHPDVVGVDIAFEEPDDRDVVVAADRQSPEDAAASLFEHLVEVGALEPAGVA